MILDKVIEIAKELKISIRGHYDESGCTPQELYTFANEIARIEREECAKICDERYMGDNNREDLEAKRCAFSIRSKP